jgi:ferric iron reductase protein FhuF
MIDEECPDMSPIVAVCQAVHARHPTWAGDMGRPRGTGWGPGVDLMTAGEGPFRALLERIGERLHTSDRRTIAASFALRYGWSSGVAIAPYLLYHCVPTVTLDNVSFQFHDKMSCDRVALHQPAGAMLRQDHVAPHPSIECLPSPQALIARLRTSLVQQAEPVVDALSAWSQFSRRGVWGLITSAWGAQFINVCGEIGAQTDALPHVRQLFAGHDVVSQMQPQFYPVTYQQVTHLYHRGASCCRYYLLQPGQYCASCPLLSQEERLRRHTQGMKTLVASRELPSEDAPSPRA